MNKTKFLQIRVSDEEKAEIKELAKANGFDSVSAFLLFLFRNFGKHLQ